jgi:hypothetical protein
MERMQKKISKKIRKKVKNCSKKNKKLFLILIRKTRELNLWIV